MRLRKIVNLTFNEDIDTSSVNVTAITIQGARSVVSNTSLYYRLTSYGTRIQVENAATITILLSDDDADALRLLPHVATMASNTYMSLDPGIVTDRSVQRNPAQPISRAEALPVSNYTADTLPPYFQNYILNLAQNSMTLTFSEPVVVSSFNPTHITMRSSGDPATGIGYNLTGGTVRTTQYASRFISFTLTNEDIMFLKTTSEIATTRTNSYLFASAGLVIDTVGNINSRSFGTRPYVFFSDISGPSLVAFDLDMNTELLTLSFDDVIDGQSINGSAITLQSARMRQPRESYTLFQLSVQDVIPNAFTINVGLDLLDLNSVKRIGDLCTNIGNCYITVESTVARDLSGNPAIPIPDGTALTINSFTEDFTAPLFRSWALDMDMGVISLTFDEVVDITTFQADQLTLQSNAVGGASSQSVSLTGRSRIMPNITSEQFDVYLTQADLNTIKASSNLGNSHSDSFLYFTMNMISDLNLNPVNAVSSSNAVGVRNFILDLTPPSLLSFSANFYIGALSLTFDETVHVSAFDFTALTLVNQPSPSPTSMYRLTGGSTNSLNSAIIIEISLAVADLNQIRSMDNLATSVSNTYISTTSQAVQDMNGNQLIEIPAFMALRAMHFVNSPILLSFEPRNYTVIEGEMVMIRVVLNTTAASEVTFGITTEDIEAVG